MPKIKNQKYYQKVKIGNGDYRYFYTKEEYDAFTNMFKSGKTSTGDKLRSYEKLVNAPQNHSGQRGYTYQTTRNAAGVTRTNTVQPTGRIRSNVDIDRTKTPGYRRTTRTNQLQSAPKNHGGDSSSENYRYMEPDLSIKTRHIPIREKLKGKDSATVTSYVVNNGKGHSYTGTTKNPVPENNRHKIEYHDSETTKKVKKVISNPKSAAKSTAKKVAKGYDNATTKMADKALKATPKIKKTAKNIAKGYDNATTKMADSALKATSKAKNTAKKVAKGYDNATTKMADSVLKATHSKTAQKAKKTAKNIANKYDNATTKIADKAWDATHSKTAQKAKKTVSSGAKKASNALTKAWNNLFKKKKK